MSSRSNRTHPEAPYFDFDDSFTSSDTFSEIPFPPVVPMPLPLPKRRRIMAAEEEDDSFSYRKAPQAPKHFKSPYVCFANAHQADVRKELGENSKVSEITHRLGEMWRSISKDDRRVWDIEAEKDKARYMREKAAYKGPWKVPSKKKKKHPNAPKRPMSAFLFFSQKLRGELKTKYPDKRNTEISRMLGELWRNAPADVREKHVRKEAEQRELYKQELDEFNKRVQMQADKGDVEDDCDESARLHRDIIDKHAYFDGTATSTYIAPLPYPGPAPGAHFFGHHHMSPMFYDHHRASAFMTDRDSTSAFMTDRDRDSRDKYHSQYKSSHSRHSSSTQLPFTFNHNRFFSPVDEEPKQKHSSSSNKELTMGIFPGGTIKPPTSPIRSEEQDNVLLPANISRGGESISWDDEWKRDIVYNVLQSEE